MTWTAQRTKVYEDRYARKDKDGKPIERDIHATWHRVAEAIGDTDPERTAFYNLLEDFKFVPGGRILTGAGTNTEVTFYNCYVIPVRNETKPDNGNDSREAIFDTISRMVNIMSRGGGVGINWSTLRPNGAYLSRINGTTTGPLEWMGVASAAVGAVMQGGSRRGAAMFMLDDWHPDIEAFIDVKRDLKKITNANISVAVSDAFMAAVKSDGMWTLRFPDTSADAYNRDWHGDLSDWIAKGHPVIDYKQVSARSIWRKLAEANWDNGEPGVIFLERYNKLSTGADVEKIISVNPCGEQGLGAYSVCNLGAMNLAAYITDGKFNIDRFSKDVVSAVRFLDNVIDKNFYGDFVETEVRQKGLRRIGLSVMGLADALIMQGMRYGSPEAVGFTNAVFGEMKRSALVASSALARDKGKAPSWDETMLDRPYFDGVSDTLKEKIRKYGMRNLFLLTQAPTGTTSILAGVNSGIEPYFAFEYERNDRTGTHLVRSALVEEYYRQNPEAKELPEYFVTANEVSVEEHIYMQAAAQKWIDSSVSKTLNAPNSHTVDDVEKAYTLAYDCGLKSIAYFRDGCGRAQVLNRVDEKPKVEVVADTKQYTIHPESTNGNGNGKHFQRPSALTGSTYKIVTAIGTAFITINTDPDGHPIEVFVNVGKGGTDLQELCEAIGRLISIALQKGVKPDVIANQLMGIGGYSKFQKSLPTAISTALADHKISEPVKVTVEPKVAVAATRSSQMCPNCQSFSLVHEEGCTKCGVCEYSAC